LLRSQTARVAGESAEKPVGKLCQESVSHGELTDLKRMYSIYRNLWRIEESFKIMKSDLDARPVFLQKTDSIKGHFLICYLAVLLERILQFKILQDQYATTEIFDFINQVLQSHQG
jgi:transposase